MSYIADLLLVIFAVYWFGSKSKYLLSFLLKEECQISNRYKIIRKEQEDQIICFLYDKNNNEVVRIKEMKCDMTSILFITEDSRTFSTKLLFKRVKEVKERG